MTEQEWLGLVAALRDEGPSNAAVDAAATLQRIATPADIQKLEGLLSDSDFFVREAAAWPLSDLGSVDSLPRLLDAFQRGIDDGHDNDGLAAALVSLVELHRDRAEPMLRSLLASPSPSARESAAWLLPFCTPR